MRQINDELLAFTETEEFKKQLNDKKLKVKDDARVTQTRKYRLITPLFGGGVEPKKNDLTKVIRETSIRGQLRFWWRALRGVGTLAQVKQREDAIFGNTNASSKVVVCVSGIQAQETNRSVAFSVGTNPNNHKPQVNSSSEIAPYAAFPLLPEKDERKVVGWQSETVWSKIEFTLQLAYPKGFLLEDAVTKVQIDVDAEAEIQAALWGWETFGGLGGRTRRGFGALSRSDIVPTLSTQINSTILGGLKQHLIPMHETSTISFPRIKSLVLNDNFVTRTFRTAHSDNCLNAWKHLVNSLQSFRQSRVRIAGRAKPSVSHWPEPDQIRRIAKRSDGRQFAHTPSHPVHSFPRALFGLPIIFEFPQTNEPTKSELKLAEYSRLASPLILRPIACADGEAVAVGLILDTPPMPTLELKGYRTTVSSDLVPDDVKHIKPMNDSSTTQINVLKSFLKTI
jgi:CRISPR-associated protein Cmr1